MRKFLAQWQAADKDLPARSASKWVLCTHSLARRACILVNYQLPLAYAHGSAINPFLFCPFLLWLSASIPATKRASHAHLPPAHLNGAASLNHEPVPCQP